MTEKEMRTELDEGILTYLTRMCNRRHYTLCPPPFFGSGNTKKTCFRSE